MPDFDLTLLSLYRMGGKSAGPMPGLAALTPPRRAAHGREHDRLIVYMALAGNVPFTRSDYETLTGQIGEKFFRTAGSLTFALKSAAEAANTTLVDRNMRTTGHGQYAMAVLALAALRGNELYLAQCGPSHVFWLGAGEPHHYFEPQLAGRGLGFSQTPRLYFAHMQLEAGDRLLVAAQLPAEWLQLLLSDRGGASMDATRRRLMASSAADIQAALLLVQSGSGRVSLMQGAAEEPATQTTASVPHAEPPAASTAAAGAGKAIQETPAPAQPTASGSRLSAFTAATVPAVMPELPPGAVPPAGVVPAAVDAAPAVPPPPQPTPAHTVPVMAREPVVRRRRRGQGVFLALAKGLHSTRAFFSSLGARANAFLPRLLPNLEDESGPPGSASRSSMRISRTTLLVIAIAVPVVIASVAAMVYFQRGRAAQFQTYYTRAQGEATQAVGSSDPAAQRTHWQLTLYWLDQAESYAISPDSTALRAQAQNSLDALDRITRLDYKSALPSKLTGTNITNMVAADNDLYMLDAKSGKILHALRSQLGYTLDNSFQCNPGSYPNFTVGPLVDMIALPAVNSVGADIMAVDAVGNALYCAPDQDAKPFQLAPPPQPLQQITAIAADDGSLYVLDAPGKTIWQYDSQQGLFNSTPLSFFGLEVPPLDTATDMTILAGDLFLLHSDGHLTSCTLSLIPDVSPTRCTEPATLVDTRAGNPSGATLTGTAFSQIQDTPAPNEYVALLDSPAQAIYRFSPSLLELQDQMRGSPGSSNPLPAGVAATAFTISPTHTIFLAVGDEVFYAEEPSP